MLRRHLLTHMSGLAGLGLLGSPLALATSLTSSAKPLKVGRQKGDGTYYFDAAGEVSASPVDYLEFSGGNLVTEAMFSQELDLGPMSEIPPIFSAARNPPFKLITVWKSDLSSQALLLPHGSNIRQLSDLKGRRVGFVKATTSHCFLLRVLAEQGLTMNDIVPVALSPQDGFAAFKSGQLDAWFIYGIFTQLARYQARAQVLIDAQHYLSGNLTFAATDSAIADPAKRRAIYDFLHAQVRVWNWIERNPEPWAAASEKLTGIPAQVFLLQHASRTAADTLVSVDASAIQAQQAVADLFYQQHILRAPIEVAPLWDHSFTF